MTGQQIRTPETFAQVHYRSQKKKNQDNNMLKTKTHATGQQIKTPETFAQGHHKSQNKKSANTPTKRDQDNNTLITEQQRHTSQNTKLGQYHFKKEVKTPESSAQGHQNTKTQVTRN